MLNRIRTFLRAATEPATQPASVPAGERYYVVGDIHGRLDLFEALIAAVEADADAPGSRRDTVVLLGDLIDRGPDSAGVVARALEWGRRRPVRAIAGNHEEMFLDSFASSEVLRHFVRYGGRETILSYGLDRADYNRMSLDELRAAMTALVPAEHRAFLEGMEDLIVAGGYAFVHAGIHPERALEEQVPGDLRWIRERFLRHAEPLSHVVVHGHTIFEGIEKGSHRIGIDTGAYRTGRLTALVLEGGDRRIIQAVESDGKIAIETGPA